MSNFNTGVLIKEIDLLIRQGRLGLAHQKIVHIYKSRTISDQVKLELSNLARRSAMPILALRILRPLIRKSEEAIRTLTDEEKTSYGASLIAIGSFQEAKGYLQESRLAQSIFFLALMSMSQWKYLEAITLLRQYLQFHSVSEYQKRVACLNLASSYLVVGQAEEAQKIISKQLTTMDKSENRLIYFFFKELSVQYLIQEKQYNEASLILQEITNTFHEASAIYKLTLDKWTLAIQAYQQKLSKHLLLEQIQFLEARAITLQQYEVLRELDLYRTIFLQDTNSFIKLWYGTPYVEYLKRIQSTVSEVYQKPISIPNQYLWNPNRTQSTDKHGVYLNLISGKQVPNFEVSTSLDSVSKVSTRQVVPSFSLTHQLLYQLCKDFYRPCEFGTLFQSLYPREKFDPFTSVGRVRKLVSRLNHQLKQADDLIQVRSLHNRFSIESKVPLFLKKNQQSLEVYASPLIGLLTETFHEQLFTNQQVKEILGVSESQTLRILNHLKSLGVLHSVGTKGQRRYSLLPLSMN